ncbi:MAG: redoxin domain-containing protein [Planctomycetaceae bacterium]|nr:redoxin domain-containing protein [Planctomycetaceae bacterium]
MSVFAQPPETTPQPTGAGSQPANPTDEPPENPNRRDISVPEGILDAGSEWLNTDHPLTLSELRGKVIVLDFWTYCCINCMHVLPDLKYLEEKYQNQLVVIGVHSAKFDNEKLSENIREAIMRYEIRHPVVNDSQMMIWQRFGTNSWPTLALIDPEGKFVGSQPGEGNRELFDEVIGKLVEYHRWKGTLDENPIVFRMETSKVAPTPLRYPGKLIADPATNRLFISDSNHNRIVVTSLDGQLLQIIGNGRAGHQDGTFDTAEFDHPQGMVLVGNRLYITDTENHLIRTVDLASGSVETLAGTGEQGRPGRDIGGPLRDTPLNSPWDITHVDGVLYIAMAGPHQIWRHALGSQIIGVHAGSGREDVLNGSIHESAFGQPSGIVPSADGHVLYVVDSEGSAIRSVPVTDDGEVTTIAGRSELPRGQSLFSFGDQDGKGNSVRFQHPIGIARAGDDLFVADTYNHKIRRLNIATQEVTTWIGDGKRGTSDSLTQLNEPAGLAVAGDQLFIADTNNHRICVADLKTAAMKVLNIEGLTPPAPPRRTTIPDEPAATDLGTIQASSNGTLNFTVRLRIPDGYKFNDLAPVTWELFAADGQTALPVDVLAVRDEATVEEMTARVSVPVNSDPGEADVMLQVSFGFCSSDAGVCRLADAAWTFHLVTSADGSVEPVAVDFPEPVVVIPPAK